jgi:hypothetical protein
MKILTDVSQIQYLVENFFLSSQSPKIIPKRDQKVFKELLNKCKTVDFFSIENSRLPKQKFLQLRFLDEYMKQIKNVF